MPPSSTAPDQLLNLSERTRPSMLYMRRLKAVLMCRMTSRQSFCQPTQTFRLRRQQRPWLRRFRDRRQVQTPAAAPLNCIMLSVARQDSRRRKPKTPVERPRSHQRQQLPRGHLLPPKHQTAWRRHQNCPNPRRQQRSPLFRSLPQRRCGQSLPQPACQSQRGPAQRPVQLSQSHSRRPRRERRSRPRGRASRSRCSRCR